MQIDADFMTDLSDKWTYIYTKHRSEMNGIHYVMIITVIKRNQPNYQILNQKNIGAILTQYNSTIDVTATRKKKPTSDLLRQIVM